jgi:hypothetical protein
VTQNLSLAEGQRDILFGMYELPHIRDALHGRCSHVPAASENPMNTLAQGMDKRALLWALLVFGCFALLYFASVHWPAQLTLAEWIATTSPR